MQINRLVPMTIRTSLVLCVLLASVGCAASLSLAGEILLSSAGAGQWQVSARGLAGIHSVDLDLRYDAQRLPGVTATVGSGVSAALNALNDRTPGVIRLAIASTQALPPNGVLLTLQSSGGGGELVVSQFVVKTADADGKPVVTALRQQLPLPVATKPLSAETSPAAVVGGASRRGGPASGSVMFPPGERGGLLPADGERKSPSTIPQPENRLAARPSESAAPAVASGPDKRFHSQEEIVAAIKRLPLPWTVAAVKALFFKDPSTVQVRQEPVVALADGRSSIRLYLPKTLSQKKPDLAAQGVVLGAIWDGREQGWQVDLVTKKNIWSAKVLLLGEKDLIQIPLVIVPPLAGIAPSASDDAILPQRDLDGDGRFTAIDAYLYVGSLLAMPQE